MAITDLTNTKWVLPSNIETQDISVVAGQDFAINFISLNTNFSQLRFGDFSLIVYKYLLYGNTEVWNYDDEWLVSNEAYRIIEITGGTDVTNSSLIQWLEANATLQPNVKTFDLSTLQLSAGTHTIQVKARASGFRDSEFSNSVSYTVASGYQVTINITEDMIMYKNYVKIYDGQDNTGTLLFESVGQVATPSPINVICTSGYLYIQLDGSAPLVVPGTTTTSANIVEDEGSVPTGGANLALRFAVNGNGTIGIEIYDWDYD